MDVAPGFPRALLMTRIQVLLFLEAASGKPGATAFFTRLSLMLLEPLPSLGTAGAAMPGSDNHSQKLRALQVGE